MINLIEKITTKGNELKEFSYVVKREWEILLADKGIPKYSNGISVMDFSELKNIIDNLNENEIRRLVNTLVTGKSLIFKNTFSDSQIAIFKELCDEMATQTPSTFYKMVDGVPNFHRNISEEVSSKYYANPIKHSHYFFPWNEGSKTLFEIVWPVWGYFKVLGGYHYDEYIRNLPKDGIIDRIQIVRYPAGGGKLDAHFDPYHGIRPVISTYMSTRGIDFHTGGAYILKEDGTKVDLEPHVKSGDTSCLFPSVIHGVDAVDISMFRDVINNTESSGRWWLGMYCNDSDMVANRKTGGAY